MKIRSERNKRTYIIIALCAILVVMGVGYAAFSSLLTINGTANISNSWCVGFDNTKTNTMEVTKGLSTGTTPTGSMSYSGTACGTNLVPTSSLVAHFYQPGDQIEYTLTITNKSTVTAAIKSILVDNESVTSDTTKKKDNITYIIEMPEDTTLAPNASTTMKVTAKFQNETDVTGAYSGETKTIEVKINAEQDDGNGGMDITPVVQTTTKYASTSQNVSVGDRIGAATADVWCVVGTLNGSPYNSCTDNNYYLESEESCQTEISDAITLSEGNISEGDITCHQETAELEPTLQMSDSCAETNNNSCLKFTLSNGVVEKIEACLVKNGNEYCLQGGPDETSSAEAPIFNSNVLFMQNILSSCGQGQYNNYECYENTYRMRAYKNGSVSVEYDGWECGASSALGYCALN